jgi:hypothetical protein
MPNVKVGSVIDLEFSFQGIPDEWRFQEEIPVLHSELIMEESPFIQLRKNFSGYERLTYSTPTKWIARDMSAFKSEPIMGPVENYITKLKFDIKAIYNYNFSTTWENVSKILLESDHFGMPAVSTLFLNSVSSKLSEKFKNKEDLLRAAYDTIRERIVWNKVNQLTSPNGNLANVYQMKVGNSGEVNLLLYKLLNKLGFDVTPVALSTRDNGNISEFFPSLRQFNYAIIHVRIEEKEYLLDATEKYLPFTMLPLRCLNTKGLYVNKDFGVWLPLTTNKKNKDFTIYDLAIDNDLNLNGNVSMMMSDYAAYDFRKKYFEFNSKNEYIESYLQRMPGLTISDLNIQDLDSIYKPVKATQTINITNEVSRVDNSLYIIPLYFSDLKENPFKLNTRKYPVDFEVLTDKTMMLNLTIPKGYAPFALPESVSLKLPGNSAVFMYDVVNTGDKIRLTTKLMINKVSFIPDEYSELKEFYNQILKKESESIILKKI